MKRINKAAVIEYLRTLPTPLKTEVANLYASQFKSTTGAYTTALSRGTFGRLELEFLAKYLVKNEADEESIYPPPPPKIQLSPELSRYFILKSIPKSLLENN
ncbi:hypothetical protein SAMN05421780_11117 [Flexibacter flexilis DSM 6793]|uniref:Uncharacterized protein n=1 Tax=Flexibacter flexilis DSM 6793 TaxID=927664 RepID=A0A1I1MUN7_9BACT|nr:hypothetical protein [Flexibacter flexilis]SFC86918.1 hypothetical protein SAMN05421780_11117 [Flexibacter flexilis DSM 6793]